MKIYLRIFMLPSVFMFVRKSHKTLFIIDFFLKMSHHHFFFLFYQQFPNYALKRFEKWLNSRLCTCVLTKKSVVKKWTCPTQLVKAHNYWSPIVNHAICKKGSIHLSHRHWDLLKMINNLVLHSGA